MSTGLHRVCNAIVSFGLQAVLDSDALLTQWITFLKRDGPYPLLIIYAVSLIFSNITAEI